MKCTPWEATGSALKGYQAEENSTYVAFQVTLTAYFENEKADVEFKYRKDSKMANLINGEFKFVVNDQPVMIDSDYLKSGQWTTYKYTTQEGPGKYTFLWIYTKYNELG